MNISIDPQIINQMVSEAIIKSAIGDQLNKAIAKSVSELSASYNNPIESVVKRFIADEALRVMREKFRDQIIEAIKKSLAEKMTDDYIDRVCAAAVKEYR